MNDHRSALERVHDALSAAGCRPIGRGDHLDARCPSHEDQNPSLSVDWRPGKSGVGSVLLRCHTGCSSEDITTALGLQMRDLFDSAGPAAAEGGRFSVVSGNRADRQFPIGNQAQRPAKAFRDWPRPLGEPVAVYRYRNAQGWPVGEIGRFMNADGKTFRVRMPHPERPGMWAMRRPEAMPLYRLPAVVEAVEAGRPVYLVEGEKCADVLAESGHTATSKPFGAVKNPDEWGEVWRTPLTGADVIVWADRDGPGYRHAACVAVALQGVARSVLIVRTTLDQGKADAADHFAAGLDVTAVEPVPVDDLPDVGQFPTGNSAPETEAADGQFPIGNQDSDPGNVVRLPIGRRLADGVTQHALMGGDSFRQYPGGGKFPGTVRAVKVDDQGEQREAILFPGRLEVPALYEVRGVSDDGTPSREVETSEYQVEFTAPGGKTAVTAVDDAELGRTGRDRSAYVRRIGLGPYLNRTAGTVIDHTIKAFAADLEGIVRPVSAYSSSGLFVADGRHTFLRAGLPALTGSGVDAGLHCRPPAGLFRDASWFDVLAYPDASPAGEAGDDARLLLAIRQAAPGDPAVDALLCQLATAPLVGLPEIKPLSMLLWADSGTGKGILQAISTGLQSYSRFVPTSDAWDPPALSAERLTALALRSRLHHLRGYVVTVLDVFQEGQTTKERDVAWQKLNMAARSAADGSGGGAMQRNGVDSRQDKIVRACITFDAEEVPDAAKRPGAMGRAFVVRLEGDPFGVKAARAAGLASRAELDGIYASLPRAGRALGSMLTAELADLDANGTGNGSVIREAVEWGRSTAAGWRIEGHSRSVPKYGQMLAGAHLLARHMGAVADLDPAALRAELAESVRKLAADQAATIAPASRTRKLHGRAVDEWTRTLRRLMEDGRALFVAAPEGQRHAPESDAVPPGRSLRVFGWREARGEFATLEPVVTGEPIGAAHGPAASGKTGGRRPTFDYGLWMFPEGFKRLHAIVLDAAERAGIALPDTAQMRRELEAARYVMPAEKDELWGSTTRRVVKLDIGRVLTLDDDDQGEGPEDGGAGPVEPGPEPTGTRGNTPAGLASADVAAGPQGQTAIDPSAGVDLSALSLDALTDLLGQMEAAGVTDDDAYLRLADAINGAAAKPEPVSDRKPTGPQKPAQRAAQRTRGPVVGRVDRPAYALDIPADVELSNFAEIIRAAEPTWWPQPVDRAELAAGLDLFHRVTDWTGLEAKSAGRVGHQVLHRLTARSGPTADLERVELPAELDEIKPKMLDPRWIDAGRVPVVGGAPVVGLDVNGQYLAATGCELGIGLPRRSGAADAAELMTRGGKLTEVPGYGQLAAALTIPGVPQGLRAGDWLVMPMLRYLVDDLGLSVELADSWVWDHSNRRLNNFYEFWRDARYALADVDMPGVQYARAAVKRIPNTFIGGWMRSIRYNNTDSLRVDWSHHIVARARVNALRAVRKAGVVPVAVNADTVYVLGLDEANRLPGGPQLGKWKVEKVAAVTAEMVAAHGSGRPNNFRDAVTESHNAEGEAR